MYDYLYIIHMNIIIISNVLVESLWYKSHLSFENYSFVEDIAMHSVCRAI